MTNARHALELLELAVVGDGVEPAVVDFAPGLNVIYGASDTGKTYVLDAIEWCLGRTKLVKNIREADGYTRAVLSLRTSSSGDWTVRRALAGGDVEIFQGRAVRGDVSGLGEARVANPTKDARDRPSLSTFLLENNGLDGRKLRVNEKGKTERLTFSVLRKLVVIDEERIIKTGSPFSTDQYTERTKYRSLMRLLLTGVDDSALVQADDASATARNAGRAQAYDDLIAALEGEVTALGIDLSTLDQGIDASDSEEEALREQLSAASSGVEQLETFRREKWLEAERERSRSLQLGELLKRFSLLQEQYASDAGRLEATLEGAQALEVIPDEPCVLCGLPGGAPSRDAHGGAEEIVKACRHELAKLTALKNDLAATISTLSAERDGHQAAAALAAVAHHELHEQIAGRLRPAHDHTRNRLEHLLAQRAALEKAALLRDQLTRLRQQRASASDAQGERSDPEEFRSHAPAHVLDGLAVTVQGLLEAWGFPDATRVSFNAETDDVIIGGKDRASFGKGYRAVAHAACTLGLMTYVVGEGKPHPGFVVLDSPLNPYEGPISEGEEAVPNDLKRLFLQTLSSSLGHTQALLLENDLPIQGGLAGVNIIEFTKTGEGRYGFFPTRRQGGASPAENG